MPSYNFTDFCSVFTLSSSLCYQLPVHIHCDSLRRASTLPAVTVPCASTLWLTKESFYTSSRYWTCYFPLAFAAPVFCTWRVLLGRYHCGVLSSLLPVTFCERGSQSISAVTLQHPGPISLTLPCPPSSYATFACSMNPRDTAVISCYVDSCHYKKREPCILS